MGPVPRTAADASPPADLVELGRIAGAYGVRGWIKIQPHGRADESVLLSAREVWIGLPRLGSPGVQLPGVGLPHMPGPGSPPGGSLAWRRVALLEARIHADVLLARLEACESREQAAELKGSAIALSRSCFPASAPGEYYWVDLIGCEVIGEQGVVLGRVLAVEDFGAPHPVLSVGGPDRETLLIPFVAPIITEVDLAAKRITADWAPDY